MKPLREGVSDRERARRDDEEAALQIRREREAEKETEAVRERIATAKERRLMDQRNKATKQLGDAPDEEDDDLASWVNKSRAIEEKKRAEDRAKAEALAKKLAEQDDDAEDLEDDEDLGEDGPNSFGANKSKSSAYTAKDLAGMKVGHGVDEVREGETVVMTLKDASILDERRSAINDETDELENVLLAENKRREKSKAASKKTPKNPFGEDDDANDANGKTVLGKYDETTEAEGLTLDDGGAVAAAELRRKEEIKRKLAASLGGVSVNATEETATFEKTRGKDFMTAAEVEAQAAAKFNKPKKKRRKKLREKREEEPEEDFVKILEAQAIAAGTSELGNRKKRGEEMKAQAEAERKEKDMRFEAAMTKAKLKTDEKILAEMAGDAGEDDAEDEELARALARSRRVAAAKDASKAREEVVREAAARRAMDAPGDGDGDGGAAGRDVVFSDTQEFVHGIGVEVRKQTAKEQPAAAPSAAMDEGDMPPVPPPPPPPPGAGAGGDDDMDHDGMPPPPPPPPPPSDDAETEARASNLGAISDVGSTATRGGIAATLEMMRQAGKLNETEMWDGRTNDKKPLALQRSREAAAISSGEFDGHKFEFHLDKFDEFGRKMTPKEAFRELCHRFHGIEPGKAKKEKRLKAYQDEVKAKKTREGDTPLGSIDKMKHVQKIQASPYVVLSGKIHAGQSSDAVSRYATAGLEDDGDGDGAGDGAGAGGIGGAPALGGAAVAALPKISGNAKVEFMMSKKGKR